MAMCPDGGLLMLGSGLSQARLHVPQVQAAARQRRQRRYLLVCAVGDDESAVAQHVIDRALAEDAPRARAEFLNIWREDLSDFIPIDVIDAATDWGVSERPPSPNSSVKYIAWADAAGGTGKDSFALAIAHKETKDRIAVLDLVRERKPRFVAAAVVAEFAEILRRYRITEIHGDAFGGGFHADAWASRGIKFKPAERTTWRTIWRCCRY